MGCGLIAWNGVWKVRLEWVWDDFLQCGVGLLTGMRCRIIAWNGVLDYCLKAGVRLLPEMGLLPGMVCGIIARIGVWDYCLGWGVRLLPRMGCGIIA